MNIGSALEDLLERACLREQSTEEQEAEAAELDLALELMPDFPTPAPRVQPQPQPLSSPFSTSLPTSIPPSPSVHRSAGAKSSRQKYRADKQRNSRAEEKQVRVASGVFPKGKVSRASRARASGATYEKLSFEMEDAPVASTGYVGLPPHCFDTAPPPTLEEAVAAGVRIIENDGTQTLAFADEKNRLAIIVVGRPDAWDGVVERASAKATCIGKRCTFAEGDEEHRRGEFLTLRRGYGFGGGSQV